MESLAKKSKLAVQEDDEVVNVQDDACYFEQRQETLVLPSGDEIADVESFKTSFPSYALVLSLYRTMPKDVQSVIAQCLYDSFNVEDFLKSKIGVVPCCTIKSTGHVLYSQLIIIKQMLDKQLVICENTEVKLLSVESGKCLQSFEKLDQNTQCGAVFSKDEDKILLGYNAKGCYFVRVLSVESGMTLHTFNHGAVSSYSYPSNTPIFRFNAAEDRVLIAFGPLVTLWSVESGECLQRFRHKKPVYEAVFNGAEDEILTISERRGGEAQVTIWSIETGKSLQPAVPTRIAIDQMYHLKVLNGKDIICMSLSNGIFQFISKVTGECLQTFKGHDTPVKTLLFTRLEDKVLSSSLGGVVKLWSIETGECLQTFHHETDWSCEILFNKAEDEILTYTMGQASVVKVWSVETGACLLTFNEPRGSIRHVVSNEANNVLIVYHNGTIKILDSSFWKRLKRSLTLLQSYLLGNIRQLAKQRLWLKLTANKGIAVLTQDGKSVTQNQLLIDFNTPENEGLGAVYEALPEEIKRVCNTYIRRTRTWMNGGFSTYQ